MKLGLKRATILAIAVFILVSNSFSSDSKKLPSETENQAIEILENYCIDCHDEETRKGNFDLTDFISNREEKIHLVFENLITGKMPPVNKKKPSQKEKGKLLDWLSKKETNQSINDYRRTSRHEFVYSVNDLLGVELDLTKNIPEDRGTNDFDSNRKILLTKEALDSYFSAADKMLNFALPENGFPDERIWLTNSIKDSHDTYSIYTQNYEDGILFSWTRANNGNNYSFFYDHFEPPVKGWYELTFDAKKIGQFDEDISILVYSGKYYFADDRPQPQRLLGVISLANKELHSHTVRAFLNPGENVSVHCYSKHTFRQKKGRNGAFIKQLKVKGPLLKQWPPASYDKILDGIQISYDEKKPIKTPIHQTRLKAIEGSISVSSEQIGMEKEKMQDGSNRTFWHSRFNPTVAEPPHFVIIHNKKHEEIHGLSYSKWTGGNGNGQVKAYSVYLSDNKINWGKPIIEGKLDTLRSYEQKIIFPQKTTRPFIKFEVTDAVSLDGKSIASIGKLDVITSVNDPILRSKISILSKSEKDLKRVIRNFAESAFSTDLANEDLLPYYNVSLSSYRNDGIFLNAVKAGLKSIICSHRFLLAPGEHSNKGYEIASKLSRILWLSVPDHELLSLAKNTKLDTETIRQQINRMLKDEKSSRMIHSFCSQWLNLRSFDKVSPSLKLYPEYNDILNHYLPIETEAFINHLIQDNLNINNLIHSDFAFLNQRLAQHYDIKGITGQKIRKISLPEDSVRGGLLTMGSILKVTADGFDTSPILRGAWISKNIVGNTLSPPPENIVAIEPDHNTNRNLKEQIEAHKKNKTCYSCHKSIDPYGFALENFDATGKWRTQYKIEKPHRGTFQFALGGYFNLSQRVDSSGTVENQKFDNISDLKKIIISDHKRIAYSFIKKFFEYANGYQPSLSQRLDLFALIPNNPKNCKTKDLITEVLMYSLKEQ
ncbi:MAG: DUF1592 domain-containing protein [Verrucomicrobiales bacterium]